MSDFRKRFSAAFVAEQDIMFVPVERLVPDDEVLFDFLNLFPVRHGTVPKTYSGVFCTFTGPKAI